MPVSASKLSQETALMKVNEHLTFPR